MTLAERLLRHARTLLTLAVLAVILVVAVAYGLSALTEPVPPLTSSAQAGACVDRPVARGEDLTPGSVTVSVLNAGGRDGLAGTTMDDLVGDGFAQGQEGNAPTEARVDTVEIWTTDGRSPAVRLLASYLGKGKVTVTDVDGNAPGISVVVGDKFTGVTAGKPSERVRGATTVCGP